MWAKISDDFFRHPRTVAAGRDARDLFLVSLTHCNEHLTDGFVAAGYLRRLAADAEIDDARAAADRLVAVGYWEECDGGWMVHDFLDYNPSRAEVLAEREKAAVRKERWKNGARNAVRNGVPNGEGTPAPGPGPVYRESSLPPARESLAFDEDGPPPAEPPRSTAPPEAPPIPVPHDPAQLRLMAAFRSERFPDQIADQCPPGELTAARQHLAALVASGATTAQVRQATAAAIRRHGRDRVTVQSIVRHWSALLEPDAPPETGSPPPGPPAGRIIPSGLRSRPSRAEEIENINREAAAAAVRHGIVRPGASTTAPTAGERP